MTPQDGEDAKYWLIVDKKIDCENVREALRQLFWIHDEPKK